ncbi:hypothetical protein BH11PSE11_BH11PSE11_29070 [soil metagenome]
MFQSDTDGEWEKFGKDDPYFGVVTDEKFRTANLTPANREEFFASGFAYMDGVIANVRRYIDPAFTIGKALDFGCGVGRLVIPLAQRARQVTGVDVSDSMLKEAAKNCEARALGNVVLVKSDDALSRLNGEYDFIHSFIVFQHIPAARGERIFEMLLSRLARGGVGVLHFKYGRDASSRRLVSFVKRTIPFASNFINLFKGREFLAPQIEMNAYDLNRLFLSLQKSGVRDCHTAFTDHEGEAGIVVYFRKA